MKNISPPLTLEEFKNITNLLFSKDEECKILAKELISQFATIDSIGRIHLTNNF